MTICHGGGDPHPTDSFLDGCCTWSEFVCPQRWFVDDTGHVIDADRRDLGTISDVAGRFENAAIIRRELQGRRTACRLTLDVIDRADNLDDADALDRALAAHPDYQPVAATWVAIGWAADTCATWGPNEQQCCYREPDDVNRDRARRLHPKSVAVNVRRS